MICMKQGIDQSIIARTFFLTSFFSFVFFVLLEFLRPGFVSRFFSVHWFLGVAILSALWLNASLQRKNNPSLFNK